jgi:tetratricopeptide (TPR) repeat protein
VDATHLRESAGELTTYAALNLVSIEVVEAPRIVRDFQRRPGALVEKICEELPAGKESAISASIDVEAITDDVMGRDSWKSLGGSEREQIASVYRRVVSDLSQSYFGAKLVGRPMRLLKLNESADHADALVMAMFQFAVQPFKFKLAKRGEVWIIMDIIRMDRDFSILSENFRPAIQAILARRNGKQGAVPEFSAYARVLSLTTQDAKAAVELADRELEKDSANRGLKFIRALSLPELERADEATRILTSLCDENPPFVPALFELATQYDDEQAKDRKRAVALYERYSAAVPDDPRPHAALAGIYEGDKDLARAEAEDRAAIERDPRNQDYYSDLAKLIALQRHYEQALAVIDDGAKHGASADELFASVLAEFVLEEQSDLAEAFAAVQPQRMEKNAAANLNLAYVRVNAGRARDSLPLLKKAIDLDPKNAEPWIELAVAYRKVGDWRTALASADSALLLDGKDSEAYYNRACALARLGRLNEAMAALNRSIEVAEGDFEEDLSQEPDLKPLANLPAFRKLIKEQNK